MIHLTRLGQHESFLLNPDLFERVDGYVDTVVRLTNGNEYVVSESASEILERIVMYRSQVLALGLRLQEAGATTQHAEHTHAGIAVGEVGPRTNAASEDIQS